MAKSTQRFICRSCGSVQKKWLGQCPDCLEWNTFEEETVEAGPAKSVRGGKAGRIAFHNLSDPSPEQPRTKTGVTELDRVLGGGLVPGSVTLIGGDPGIGKSTLLLQVAGALAEKMPVAYVSGEEAVEQIRLRARRLDLAERPVRLAAATSVRDILASLESADAPDLAIIDSIQTMYVDTLDSAPGSVSQVRASSAELIRLAKQRNLALMIVGHVTKDGAIAGPRVLEHMVDTVLYFEGDRGHQFRILRGVKNRFGATDEIGVFEMTGAGLREVPNPSELFLADRSGSSSGSAVFAGMEGTRPVLVEIQALVAPSALGTPRRAVVGWDSSRLAMLIAVLEARCGVVMGMNDVYLNVAGGLRVAEPAADLAVVTALLSSLSDEPVPADTVIFGEVGLSGEIRAVAQGEQRLKEANKLGFARALMPQGRAGGSRKSNDEAVGGLTLDRLARLDDLLPLFGNLPGR